MQTIRMTQSIPRRIDRGEQIMANKKIPMRQCIGCGEMKPKKEMIRVIKTAEDEIILDTTGRKNGRGAYICPESECLQKAIKCKGLER